MPGGDVHASLGDPCGLVTTRGTSIEARVELVEVFLEIVPTRLGGVKRREEESGAAEIVGIQKTERLARVLTDGG